MHEVQQFWRAYGHSQGLQVDHADSESRGVSPLVPSNPGSASAGTGLRSNEGGTEIRQDYVHLEICDSCNKVCLPCFSCARDDFLMRHVPDSPSLGLGTSA